MVARGQRIALGILNSACRLGLGVRGITPRSNTPVDPEDKHC